MANFPLVTSIYICSRNRWKKGKYVFSLVWLADIKLPYQLDFSLLIKSWDGIHVTWVYLDGCPVGLHGTHWGLFKGRGEERIAFTHLSQCFTEIIGDSAFWICLEILLTSSSWQLLCHFIPAFLKSVSGHCCLERIKMSFPYSYVMQWQWWIKSFLFMKTYFILDCLPIKYISVLTLQCSQSTANSIMVWY